MKLTPVMTRFFLRWGEMGARCGVNRAVAQIHALLYLAPTATPADGIAATLNVARSNVSARLKELHGWGLVNVTGVFLPISFWSDRNYRNNTRGETS